MARNELCGLDGEGDGTYTVKCAAARTLYSVTKLCEGLKGSAVTSLKCAATPKCLLLCQRALT